jgi:NAD(P)-dependent dehydrogenase (short-subunit alcohol dehydrogenase family)
VCVYVCQAVFSLTRLFLPLLEACASPDCPSRVINIGSIDGLRVCHVDSFAYSASKAALHRLTQAIHHTGMRGGVGHDY